MNLLKEWTNDFLHLIFPHNCTGCGSDIVSEEQQLCLRCSAALPSTNFFEQPCNPVEASFYGRIPVRHAAAAYYFTKDSLIQHLIFQLKYRGNKQIGTYLGMLMGQEMLAAKRFNDVDVLIPLPLNPKRELKRGYNQATQICMGIQTVLDKPMLEKAVIRKVYTETQTHMGRINRWQNMDGVFAVNTPEMLQGKHILLVDDVVTTGATLEACSMELLKIPQTTISIATIAYTV